MLPTFFKNKNADRIVVGGLGAITLGAHLTDNVYATGFVVIFAAAYVWWRPKFAEYGAKKPKI